MRRQEAKKIRALYLRKQSAPVLSEATLGQITALSKGLTGGEHHVGVFHEEFCARALKNGAKKCMCVPDVRLIRDVDENGKAIEF